VNYLDHTKVFTAPTTEDVALWAAPHRDEMLSALREQGAIVLRGFDATGDSVAEDVLRVLSPELLEDAFWSTPRTGVSGKTFTATEYPGPRTISLHSEMSYMRTFPRLLCFHSLKVAEEGGQTTIASLDTVSRELGDSLDRFESGVLYRRYFHPGVDIPWQQAFRTDSKDEVEQTARRLHMDLTWLESGGLCAAHKAQGVIKSEDGSPLYFNQAHLFHSSNLGAGDRETLSSLFGADQLPRDAFFASGEPIPDELVAHIHRVLERNTINVDWQPGDVLIIDNMRFMHGRRPFGGTRKLHVAMAIAQNTPSRSPLLPKKSGGLLSRLFG
jgi:alpha-ketoglutarate-dependent taurine dioxygenase